MKEEGNAALSDDVTTATASGLTPEQPSSIKIATGRMGDKDWDRSSLTNGSINPKFAQTTFWLDGYACRKKRRIAPVKGVYVNEMLMDLTNLESRHIFVSFFEIQVFVSQVVEIIDTTV